MEHQEDVKEDVKVEYDFKTTSQYYNALRYSAEFVINKIGDAEIAVVLGSGLGVLVDLLEDPQGMDYSEVPFMPSTSVIGHGKMLYTGKIGGKKVLLWSGRIHMYEGYSSDKLTFITYLSAFIGCKYIILTNSSGGGLVGMKHGSFMVSKDHINFAAKCPIPATFNDSRFGHRNPRSTDAHSVYLRELSKKVAKDNDVELFEGNYCWFPGPCYETPLEVAIMRKYGAGCFGMSTVPEILAAGQIGLECVVLTMITNLAAGLQAKLSHIEVHDEAMKAGPKLGELVRKIIKEIDLTRETNLQLHDHISEELTLPSYSMKNPKPQFPISEWIQEAVEVLSNANLGHSKVDDAYWFMSTGAHADILKNADLKDIREITFEELPNLPAKTSAAKHSKIVFATTTKGKRVMLILNSFLEGLIPTEALFVTNLLKAFGVSMIKFVIEATTTHRREGLKEGCFVVASDYMNKSYFTPTDPNPGFYYPLRTIQKKLAASFRSTLVENLSEEISGFEDICYILQDGPCFPSDANVNVYKNCGQDLITMTNTSAIDCANTLGMLQMTFVVVRDRDFENHDIPNAKEIAKALFENFSSEAIYEEIKFTEDMLQITKNSESFNEYSKKLDLTDIEHIETEIPLYTNPDDLDTVSKTCSEFLGLTGSNYIGIISHHLAFNQISHHFNIKKVVRFTSVSDVRQKLPELILATFVDSPDKEILIMKGMIIHQELLDTTSRTIPTRILRKLGVDKFFILGNVFGVDDNMKVGDLVLPMDHINISVLNPTFGKNIDEWGKRFYDVSKCYNHTLIDKFAEIAQEKGNVQAWKVGLAYTINSKPYTGLAEKRFCEGIGSINDIEVKATSFQGFPEMMTIRHMDFEDEFKNLYIGVVYDKCVNEDSEELVDTFKIDQYKEGINNIMEVFKQFVKVEEF